MGNMDIVLRLERPEDHHAVGTDPRSVLETHPRVSATNTCLLTGYASARFLCLELDYVAEVDGRIVGNIMYTKARIVEPSGKATRFSHSDRSAYCLNTRTGGSASPYASDV